MTSTRAQGRPRASLSLDLDNLWSYQKIHGDAGWDAFPSYLERGVPIILEQLKRHGVRLTVFIVGQDAALAKNAGALRAITDAGHEVGNHSFSHEPWLHTFDRPRIEREIADAEAHIERVTGKRPRGFRGPGFSLSQDTLEVLAERDYLYDASTFPTFLGPIARAYYFFQTPPLDDTEKEKRKLLFGKASDGLQPLAPYTWELPGRPLLEIPVTTMPVTRAPIHMSYVIYLALRSRAVARAYLASAMALCRARGVEPSYLLHPLDFLGGDEVKELAFFPGMGATTRWKHEVFADVIGAIQGSFQTVTMEEHAEELLASARLGRRRFG